MIDMAKGMKMMAEGFKAQFKKDEQVMADIQQEQEENIRKTEIERKRISERIGFGFFNFWQKLFTLILGLVLFVFMIFFIWTFPSKIKHYQPKDASA